MVFIQSAFYSVGRLAMLFFILFLIFLSAASSVEFQNNFAPLDFQSRTARSIQSAFIKDGVAFTHAHFPTQFQQLDVPSTQFRCFLQHLVVPLIS